MTLDLDLNASQQDQVYEIHLENAKLREAKREARSKDKDSGEKPGKDHLYERLVERLDHKIATKQKMKAILDKDQYEKWSDKYSRLKDRRRDKMSYKKRQ